MGSDKALLQLEAGGERLWERQVRVLRSLGAREILWSGPPRPGIPGDLRVVPDGAPDSGPLSGICACLGRMESDLLVVIGVDLPGMEAAYLRKLVLLSEAGRGAVPRGEFFEPMAAVYPRTMATLAADHLARGRLSLQELLGSAEAAGLVRAVPVGGDEAPLFRNLNTPADLRARPGNP
jgi:molybdopterin-guanine dinucleotide biosynthesis protein A